MQLSALLCNNSVDRLIEEIGKCLPFYLKSFKEYADTNLKKKLWEEVCIDMIDKWQNLCPEEKKTQGKYYFNFGCLCNAFFFQNTAIHINKTHIKKHINIIN